MPERVGDNNILNLRKIEKTYGDFHLGPVTYEFKYGRIYYICGENGSGKTTLLNIMANLIKPDSGSISYFSMPMKKNSKWIKNRISFLPNRIVFPIQSTPEWLAKLYQNMYEKFSWEQYFELLKQFEILNRKMPMEKMSDGMRKKTMIALQLSFSPQLIIADEIFNFLDKDAILVLIKQFRKMSKEKGASFILTGHQFQIMEEIASDVIKMKNGQFGV